MPPVTVVAVSGRQHQMLGQLVVEPVGSAGAIAMSAGRLPKRPPPLDPNEDAALVAFGPAGALAVVIDGHHGADAAAATLETVQQRAVRLLQGPVNDPRAALNDVLAAAQARVRTCLAQAAASRGGSRAAVTLALATCDSVWVATIGDTAAWLLRSGWGRRSVTFAGDRRFLGAEPMTARVDRATWSARDWLVLASDGLTDFVPRGYVRRLVAQAGPGAAGHDLARRLLDTALLGGAGDNVTVVCLGFGAVTGSAPSLGPPITGAL